MPLKSAPTPKAIDQVIRKNLVPLRKPGVLTVRPGFEIAHHQLTGKPAIVVTVHKKTVGLPKNQKLPDHISGIPVDVREATGNQRLRAHDPAAAALAQAHGRPEDKEPTWPFEREMPSGQLLKSPQTMAPRALVRLAAAQPATRAALASSAKKPQISYVPAAHMPLDPVITSTTITAHVSPDAGLLTLEGFLTGTKKSLVIGMYDFTSATILNAFENALTGGKTLQMVLDNPPPNDTRDQTDTQTVQELNSSLGNRSKIVRALERQDTFAAAWMFPFAYHIKVIVRDNSALWLSSGNLNNSNQPDLTSPKVQKRDRDWHVIIEDPGLAQLFAAYLNQDFASAKANQASSQSAATTTAAVADANAKLAANSNPPPPPPGKAAQNSMVLAKVFRNVTAKITPLLTPDTLPGNPPQGQYLSNMIQLIHSAQKSLCIQLQYIETSNGGDYETLLQAIADRVSAGVDVRLIESLEFGEKWAEKMKAQGVDLTANIALQSNVHNKGFVVDSRVVVVSSQNFSPAGVETNRDAGVIIENADVAKYFEAVFLADWTNLATPFDPHGAAQLDQKHKPPLPAAPVGKAKPPARGGKKKPPARSGK
jgi:phosphatidylserine/phosphatidylglycerophosphate/cardiolipin synthase-like enzyme